MGPVVGGGKFTNTIRTVVTVCQYLCNIGHSWGWDLGFLHVVGILPHCSHVIVQSP